MNQYKMPFIKSGLFKSLIAAILLLITGRGISQGTDIIKLAFSDNSTFDITTTLGDKRPARFRVLDSSDVWDEDRFYLKYDLTSAAVLKGLEEDEHSPYHRYLFSDSLLNSHISDQEKINLFTLSKSTARKKLVGTFAAFTWIKSFTAVKSGFFFSMTEPLFSTDKTFAFLNITVYKKDKYTENLRDSNFGNIMLIYEKNKTGTWSRLRKVDRIFF